MVALPWTEKVSNSNSSENAGAYWLLRRSTRETMLCRVAARSTGRPEQNPAEAVTPSGWVFWLVECRTGKAAKANKQGAVRTVGRSLTTMRSSAEINQRGGKPIPAEVFCGDARPKGSIIGFGSSRKLFTKTLLEENTLSGGVSIRALPQRGN